MTRMLFIFTESALRATPGVRVRTEAISNGLDTTYFSPGDVPSDLRERFGIHPTKKLLVYAGRLDGEKRVDLLIDAMGHLCDRRDDVQLVVIGKGLRDNELRQQASVLSDHVVFTGYIKLDDHRDLLREATLFVMPSPAELQCIAALEAMACGTPIVVADQVALPELLDEGRNGRAFHYPSANDLAHQIALLLNEPDLPRMAEHAVAWTTRHHSVRQTVRQYRSLYEWAMRLHPFRSEIADE